MRNNFWKNVFHLSSEQIIKLTLGLISSIVIARFLSPEDLGKLSLILSFGIIFSHFTVFGTHEITIKSLLEKKEKHNEIMGSSFFLRITGCFIGIILISMILFTKDFYSPTVKNFILLYCLFQCSKVFDLAYDFFISNIDVSKIAFHRSFSTAAFQIIKIVTAYILQSWEIIALIIFSELIFFAAIHLSVYQNTPFSIKDWLIDKQIVKHLFNQSKFSFLLTFSVFALLRVDQLMISHLLDFKQNGYYSISSRIIEVSLFIPTTLSTIFFPKIINSLNKKEEIKKMYSILFYIAFIIAIIINIIGPSVIPVVFGKQYTPSVEPLMINSWNLIFIYWNIARIKSAPVLETMRSNICITLTMLLLNIVFNYIFIPKYGIVGASYSTLLSPIISIVIFSIILKSIRDDTLIFISSIDFFKYLKTKKKNHEI